MLKYWISKHFWNRFTQPPIPFVLIIYWVSMYKNNHPFLKIAVFINKIALLQYVLQEKGTGSRLKLSVHCCKLQRTRKTKHNWLRAVRHPLVGQESHLQEVVGGFIVPIMCPPSNLQLLAEFRNTISFKSIKLIRNSISDSSNREWALFCGCLYVTVSIRNIFIVYGPYTWGS